jgi:hypothetical protein
MNALKQALGKKMKALSGGTTQRHSRNYTPTLNAVTGESYGPKPITPKRKPGNNYKIPKEPSTGVGVGH